VLSDLLLSAAPSREKAEAAWRRARLARVTVGESFDVIELDFFVSIRAVRFAVPRGPMLMCGMKGSCWWLVPPGTAAIWKGTEPKKHGVPLAPGSSFDVPRPGDYARDRFWVRAASNAYAKTRSVTDPETLAEAVRLAELFRSRAPRH
jgi:hypothetical protein